MSLRLRLTFALVIAAILPMVVAVGVTMLRAERRAEQEATGRLQVARRQAEVLIDRLEKDVVIRLDRAATDLPHEFFALEELLKSSSAAGAAAAPSGAASPGGATPSARTPLTAMPPPSAATPTTARDSAVTASTAGAAPSAAPVTATRPEATQLATSISTTAAPLAGTAPTSISTTGSGAGTGVAPKPAREERGSAREIAPSLAERFGLDYLEILDGEGRILATSSMRVAGVLSSMADLVEGSVSLRELPQAARIPTTNQGRPRQVAFLTRRAVPIGNEPLDLVGGRLVDRELVESIAAVSGGPSALIDDSGNVVMTADTGSRREQHWISELVPLAGEGGWRIRVSVPAGDVREARRELLGVFASIAPFALVSALVVGIILAGGISRPIRALAARAEDISAAQSGPMTLLPEKDEVHRLTISFDRMLDALSLSEQERVSAERIAAWQEVARRIAHEVKNPLSPIKLAVENLRRTREKAPAEFDRALEEETATILEEVESLRRLVDEFSQFARLPAPQPASCDVRQIVSQSLSLFAARLEAAGVKVKLASAEAPETIEADAEQIGRVVKNVIANALDALEPVGDRRLAISIRQVETLQGEWVEIEVIDSGVGFDAGVQKRIFEPYFTTRSQRGGAGLGMAIAHRIVAEHGGTIQASGAPGRGATITIRLPIDHPQGGSA